MKIALLSFAALICAGLIGVFIRQELFFNPEQHFTAELETAISADLPGWTSEEKEFTDYEGEILNFEEAIHRVYSNGEREVDLYVGYWKPKQMPVRQVQSHTPDVCWVRNGAELQDKEYGVQMTSEGTQLHPAEFRSFTMPRSGSTSYVYYWHTVGDTLYVNRLKEAGQFDRLDPIKTVFRFGLDQMQEQFFVRISSNKPFYDLFKSDPGMRQLLSELTELTLAAPAAEEIVAVETSDSEV